MIVKLVNLNKSYKFKGHENQVLKDVNLEVNYGDFITIQGKSGSGKSTLLNLISGIVKPSSGEVILEGKNMGSRFDITTSHHRGKYVGFIFQSFNLIPYQTVIENVMAPLKFQSTFGLNHKEKAMKALEDVELTDKINHYPGILSGGQMQRVAIARAIVKEPKLIIADEPTGNLDSKTANEIVSIFKKLNTDKNITFIMVTHDESLTHYATRKYIMKDKNIHEV